MSPDTGAGAPADCSHNYQTKMKTSTRGESPLSATPCSQVLRLYKALVYDVSDETFKGGWWKYVAAKSKKQAGKLVRDQYECKIDVTVYRVPLTGEREEWIICPANVKNQAPPPRA